MFKPKISATHCGNGCVGMTSERPQPASGGDPFGTSQVAESIGFKDDLPERQPSARESEIAARSERSQANEEAFFFHPEETNRGALIQSPVDQISFLQRTIGNREVEHLLKSGVSRAKLTKRQFGTGDEQENRPHRVPSDEWGSKRFAEGLSLRERSSREGPVSDGALAG
jgi:hypothetical protein